MTFSCSRKLKKREVIVLCTLSGAQYTKVINSICDGKITFKTIATTRQDCMCMYDVCV